MVFWNVTTKVDPLSAINWTSAKVSVVASPVLVDLGAERQSAAKECCGAVSVEVVFLSRKQVPSPTIQNWQSGPLPTAICVLRHNGGTLGNGVRACSSPLQVLTRRGSARALKLTEGGCAKIAQGAARRQRWVVVRRASSGVGECHVGGSAPPAPCWVVTVRAPPVQLAALTLVVVHSALQAIAS